MYIALATVRATTVVESHVSSARSPSGSVVATAGVDTGRPYSAGYLSAAPHWEAKLGRHASVATDYYAGDGLDIATSEGSDERVEPVPILERIPAAGKLAEAAAIYRSAVVAGVSRNLHEAEASL